MPHLPKKSVKHYVLGIKQLLQSTLTTHYLIPNTLQQGFALIPIVILLLITGITAAVYLTQSGPSFLPKAAPQTEFFCTPDDVQPDNNTINRDCPSVQKKIFKYCTNTNDSTITQITNQIACDAAYRADPNQIVYVCKWDPLECPAQKKTCRVNGREVATDTSVEVCSADPSHAGEIFSQTCNDGQVITSYRKDGACGVSQPAPAPATTSTLYKCTKDNVNTTQKCNAFSGMAGTDECKSTFSHCDLPSAGNKDLEQCKQLSPNQIWCSVTPTAATTTQGSPTKIQAKKCNPSQTKPAKSIGCYVDSEGNDRWMFNTSEGGIKCTQDEVNWCKNYRSSEGCETIDTILTENSTDTPVQFTRCIPPKTGTGASRSTSGTQNTGNGSTSAGTSPTTQKPETAQSVSGTKPASDLICGKDDKGIDIPCYAVGVFSASELKEREAQATLASINYTKFREIIDQQEAAIGKAIADNARQKIEAAEKEVKACLEKK